MPYILVTNFCRITRVTIQNPMPITKALSLRNIFRCVSTPNACELTIAIDPSPE